MSDFRDIPKKHILWSKIRRACELFGEEPAFIGEYAKDVYNMNKDDLDAAILCFEALVKQGELLGKRNCKVVEAQQTVYEGGTRPLWRFKPRSECQGGGGDKTP